MSENPVEVYKKACAAVEARRLHEAVSGFALAKASFETAGKADHVRKCDKGIDAVLSRMTENPYMALGVNPEVDTSAMKKAYRKLILRYHPDKNPVTGPLFRVIQEAYEKLSDDTKRAAIDAKRKREKEKKDAARAARSGGSSRASKPPTAPTSSRGAPSTRTSSSSRGASSSSRGASSSSRGPSTSSSSSSYSSRRSATTGSSRPHVPPGGRSGAPKGSHSSSSASGRKESAYTPKPLPKNPEYEELWTKCMSEWVKAKRPQFNHYFTAWVAAHFSDSKKRDEFFKYVWSHNRGGGDFFNRGAKSPRPASYTPRDKTGAGLSKPPGVPSAPRLVTRTDSTITFTWNAAPPSSTEGVASEYELQWRQVDLPPKGWSNAPKRLPHTTCRKKNLKPGVGYEFRVRSWNVKGCSAYSAVGKISCTGEPSEGSKPGDTPRDRRERRDRARASELKEQWKKWKDDQRAARSRSASRERSGSADSRGSRGSRGSHGPRDPSAEPAPASATASTAPASSTASEGKDDSAKVFAPRTPQTYAWNPTAEDAFKEPPAEASHRYTPSGASTERPKTSVPRFSGASMSAAADAAAEVAAESYTTKYASTADPSSGWATDRRTKEDYATPPGGDDASEWDSYGGESARSGYSGEGGYGGAEPWAYDAAYGTGAPGEWGEWSAEDWNAWTERGGAEGEDYSGTGAYDYSSDGYDSSRSAEGAGGTDRSWASPRWAEDGSWESPRLEKEGGYAGSGEAGEDEAGEWYEMRDPASGAMYYVHSGTGDSQWEPPKWVDELDPASGVTYYINSYTGESQWEVPSDFIPIVREGTKGTTSNGPLSSMYTPGEKSFLASMLSPGKPPSGPLFPPPDGKPGSSSTTTGGGGAPGTGAKELFPESA